MPFEMPALPFGFDGLEPYIDARTVEIHSTKHHATYLKNLNTALDKYPEYFQHRIEDILKSLDSIPDDIRLQVRGNGGGYYNHNLYWENLGPNRGGEPKGDLGKAINQQFGSYEAFKQEFEKAGLSRLGSGYAWLSKKKDGSLIVHSTPNQDTPLADGLSPILVCDVWEHAYYLKYQNRRAEYLTNWWNLANWEVAVMRFSL